jgi:hypothetical protein
MKRADAEYAAAFRKAGMDLDTIQPAEAGKWIAARSEVLERAGHLDDWAYIRIKAQRAEADWRRLVAAARAADPDPWRDALRAKFGAKDAVAIAEFRRLAGGAPPGDLRSVMTRRGTEFISGCADRDARPNHPSKAPPICT